MSDEDAQLEEITNIVSKAVLRHLGTLLLALKGEELFYNTVTDTVMDLAKADKLVGIKINE